MTALLGLCLLASLWFNYHYHNQKDGLYQQVTELQVIVKSNNRVIDSLTLCIVDRDKQVERLLNERKALAKAEQGIIITYQKTYEKIAQSNDTAQLNLLYSFLAKHKGLPVARN